MTAGLRFVVASIAAFTLDLALVLALRVWTGAPLWLAAAISFVVVGVIFYFVHEHWTYAQAGGRSSARRLGQMLLSLAAAFAVRVGVIAVLEAIRTPDTLLAAIYVGIGAAASLTANYILSRFWVFRR